jgi:hypothetical protein
MLCVYQALRDLIAQAADRTGIDPDRISFNSALDAARRSAGTAPPRRIKRATICWPTSPAGPSADGKVEPTTCGETTLIRTLPLPSAVLDGEPELAATFRLATQVPAVAAAAGHRRPGGQNRRARRRCCSLLHWLAPVQEGIAAITQVADRGHPGGELPTKPEPDDLTQRGVVIAGDPAPSPPRCVSRR